MRKELQAIQAEYDPAQYDFLTATPPTDVDSLTALLTSLLQKLNRDEAATQFFIATLARRGEAMENDRCARLARGLRLSASAIKNMLSASATMSRATTLRFTGLMTAAEQHDPADRRSRWQR